MKKSKTNFIIDALMFIDLLAIIGIGFLIKYILISGAEKWLHYGMNFKQAFLGIDRHQWSSIHLILGFVLMGLLILHIVSHWNTIVCLYKKFFRIASIRLSVAILFIVLSILLLSFPFLSNIEMKSMEKERISGSLVNKNHNSNNLISSKDYYDESEDTTFAPLKSTEVDTTGTKSNINKRHDSNYNRQYRNNPHRNDRKGNNREYQNKEENYMINGKEILVKGYMTLKEVSEKYKVPTKYIKEKLNISISTSDNERFSSLRRAYRFIMNDVERIIYDYLNK